MMSTIHPSAGNVHTAIAEALSGIRSLAGIRFRELDPVLSLKDSAKNKAEARNIVDKHVSGLDALERYGVTVRTLPVSDGGRVIWPTKIIGIDFAEVARVDFHRSTVGAMLRYVLFLPVTKPDRHHPGDWYLRDAFAWSPEGHELGLLDADYEEVRQVIVTGHPDDLSSSARTGQGRWLMPKTSGRGNQDLVHFQLDGRHHAARRRAFFVREILTQGLMERTA